MKVISPLPHKRGRIEIIPLIDIMFFLLAAFMVVSIDRIKVDSLKVALPTEVPSAVHETKEDFVSISLNADGLVQVDKDLMPDTDTFKARLATMYAANPEQKILISADREARHGDMMTILGKIRQAGFQKVAFALKNEGVGSASGGGGAAPAGGPAPAGAPAPAGPTAPAAPAAAPSAPSASVPAATAPSAPASPSPTPDQAAPAAAPAPAAPAPSTH